MGDLLNSVKSSNIIQSVDARRQTAVETEDLVVDEGGEGKVIEEVCEVFPDIGVAIFSEALIIEAVDLGNLSGFVVSSENGDALGVSNLEGDKQGDSLDRVIASVNVIAYANVNIKYGVGNHDGIEKLTHEEVICVWVGATNLEQLHQVVELTVDITTDCDGAFLISSCQNRFRGVIFLFSGEN